MCAYVKGKKEYKKKKNKRNRKKNKKEKNSKRKATIAKLRCKCLLRIGKEKVIVSYATINFKLVNDDVRPIKIDPLFYLIFSFFHLFFLFFFSTLRIGR